MEPIRIYLTGRLTIEGAGVVVGAQDLPGRQGRLALAYLTCRGVRAVSRLELGEAIWGDEMRDTWDGALSALMSKLRTVLAPCGLSVDGRAGAYQIMAAGMIWVDVEAAASALDEAEAAMRRGDHRAAWGHANVTCSIAERPLLPGDETRWLEAERGRLRAIAVRGKECLADIALERGEFEAAARFANEIVALERFRETAYLRLMRALSGMGNTAEALRVYDGVRRLLADELGADPSAQLRSYHAELLGA